MTNIFFSLNSILSVVLPQVKSSGKKTFRYSGGKIWNVLPVSLRTAEDLLLLRKEPISISEELNTEARSDFHSY